MTKYNVQHANYIADNKNDKGSDDEINILCKATN